MVVRQWWSKAGGRVLVFVLGSGRWPRVGGVWWVRSLPTDHDSPAAWPPRGAPQRPCDRSPRPSPWLCHRPVRKGRCEEGERYEVRQWYGARVGEEAVALVTMALTHDHDVLSGTSTLHFTIPYRPLTHLPTLSVAKTLTNPRSSSAVSLASSPLEA